MVGQWLCAGKSTKMKRVRVSGARVSHPNRVRDPGSICESVSGWPKGLR